MTLNTSNSVSIPTVLFFYPPVLEKMPYPLSTEIHAVSKVALENVSGDHKAIESQICSIKGLNSYGTSFGVEDQAVTNISGSSVGIVAHSFFKGKCRCTGSMLYNRIAPKATTSIGMFFESLLPIHHTGKISLSMCTVHATWSRANAISLIEHFKDLFEWVNKSFLDADKPTIDIRYQLLFVKSDRFNDQFTMTFSNDEITVTKDKATEILKDKVVSMDTSSN